MLSKAKWPWPHKHAANAEVEFGPRELNRIRGLTVCWNPGEAGAAGLADSSFLEFDGLPTDEELLTDLFFQTAKLAHWGGVIRNPFGQAQGAADEEAHCLADIPDQGVADLLRTGEDIEFAPDDDLLALWSEANLRGEGIDCKRPFGSGNVSGDIRAVIDPDKDLSNAAFSKRRKHLESRMMLMLLRFVQAADLPFGTYRRDEGYQWHLASGPG